MTYSRSKKLTDTEKKLQILRNQLYGKERVGIPKQQPDTTIKSSSFNFTSTSAQILVNQPTDNTETTFLKQDLSKILLLAALAIATQLILYFSLTNRLFKF